eukprot:2814725-Alexandrium_andersonii.AAC.1
MSALASELLQSRASSATPGTSPEAPSSSTTPKPKHMPAAKYFPAKANFIAPPAPGAQQVQFAPRVPDFEPPITPCASVPGRLREQKPK